MIRLLIAYGILLLSVYIGINMVNDAGYVLVSYGTLSIETSVWKAAFLLIVTFLLLHYFLRSASFVFSLNSRFKNWITRRRSNKSHNLTMQGLLEFSEGKWRAAEKHLLKAVANSDNPLVNYLTAARAAQEQGSQERRDSYLKRAQDEVPSAKVAVDLAKARLYLSSGEKELALQTLAHLNEIEPSQVEVLKLLYPLYLEQNKWTAILALLPQLRRYHVLAAMDCDELEERCQFEILNGIQPGTDVAKVTQIWVNLSYHLRRQPSMIAAYAKKLNELNRPEDAEHILTQCLKRELHEECLDFYGKTVSPDPAKQLRKAEDWLQKNPMHPTLLLALARIAMRCQLWGKARTYYENSITANPNPTAYAELAKLHEQLGERDLAKETYRKGLALSESE